MFHYQSLSVQGGVTSSDFKILLEALGKQVRNTLQ